jgi:ribonuclease P/MRP protein subunit RPP1
MKRTFADMHLHINPLDQINTQNLLNKTAALGYKLVGIPFSPQAPADQISKVKNMCKIAGLDLASRVDIHPRSQNELVSLLRRLRRRFEIICVLSESKDIARYAAKDRRVDLLNFPHLDYHKRFFDRAEAELAHSSLATLEVDIKPLLVLKGPPRIRFLSYLRREVKIALDFGLPVVVSSGSSDSMLLRKPREMALMASLFGLDGDVALDSVSKNSVGLVIRNRQKLSGEFVAPGIRVIKQGEDC